MPAAVRGLEWPPPAPSCRDGTGGSIHGPTCPRELRAASQSVSHLSAPIFLLPAPGVPWHPAGGGDARAGGGTGAQGAELCFPSGTVFQGCLPSPGSGACSHLGRVFPRRADAAGKPSHRQSYAPVVPDDALCGNTGGTSWGGNGIGMDGIRWNGKAE